MYDVVTKASSEQRAASSEQRAASSEQRASSKAANSELYSVTARSYHSHFLIKSSFSEKSKSVIFSSFSSASVSDLRDKLMYNVSSQQQRSSEAAKQRSSEAAKQRISN